MVVPAPPESCRMPPNPTRLLVLEDDPVIAGIIATLAGEVGMQARIASDGADFFDILTHWMPTHVSVDLMMPGIDGVQILARLSQLACEARILIVSGVDSRVLASAMRMAREHELPVLGSLGKPFVHAELKALLAMPLAASHPADAALRLPDIGADSRGAALDRGEFVLHYQPKVDLPARAVSGFEALARWHHPRHGILSPDWFIPSLEEDGSIVRLTGQVLEQAAMTADPMHQHHHPGGLLTAAPAAVVQGTFLPAVKPAGIGPFR